MNRRLGVVMQVLLATASACSGWRSGISPGTNGQEAPACPALPSDFQETDLVGTWVGVYFGNTDRLVIRDDGTYKQVFQFYQDELPSFETEWNNWYLERNSHGDVELHLIGMRRCDGTDSECNNPGGGLPDNTPVANPCQQAWVQYPAGQVILFVTGSDGDVPRGIVFRAGRLAGSDWSYTYELEK